MASNTTLNKGRLLRVLLTKKSLVSVPSLANTLMATRTELVKNINDASIQMFGNTFWVS